MRAASPAEGSLHEKEPQARHELLGEGQHLGLAPDSVVARLRRLSRRRGEGRVRAVEPARYSALFCLIPRRRAAGSSLDGELGKMLAPLRHVADPEPL